jgi:hypothetical protein
VPLPPSTEAAPAAVFTVSLPSPMLALSLPPPRVMFELPDPMRTSRRSMPEKVTVVSKKSVMTEAPLLVKLLLSEA